MSFVYVGTKDILVLSRLIRQHRRYSETKNNPPFSLYSNTHRPLLLKHSFLESYNTQKA